MSGLVMGLVWELPIEGEFGRAEKFILLAYADHSDQKGKNIFPSVDLISAKTGYRERAVQLSTRTLENLGLLVNDGLGPFGTNRWHIPLLRTDGGVKIAPPVKSAPTPPDEMSKNAPEEIAPLEAAEMSKNAPEGNAPEGNAPEPEEVVKESFSSSSSGAGLQQVEQPAKAEQPARAEQPIARPNIFGLYEENIGALTPILADLLREAEKEYAPTWVEYAFREACNHNKRSWKYVETILKRIKTEGFGGMDGNKLSSSAGKTSSGSQRKNAAGASGAAPTDASRAAAERINARRREKQSIGV